MYNFNYGQINLEKATIADGLKYTGIGLNLSPRVINSFIKKNSNYFGETEWPLFRNFFLGVVTPNVLWDNFPIFSKPSTGTIQKYWGATFFGLPVQLSLLIIIILYVVSSLIVPTHFYLKKMGECVLCGKPVCKKCRVNDYCNECQAVLQNISNESLVSALKIKIADTKRISILIRAHISDIFFPGTRDFFLKTKSKRRIIILLPLTFIAYSCAIFIANVSPTLFSSISQQIRNIMLIPASIYFVCFALINVKSFIPAIVKGNK